VHNWEVPANNYNQKPKLCGVMGKAGSFHGASCPKDSLRNWCDYAKLRTPAQGHFVAGSNRRRIKEVLK